jgi:hypothetical protein
MGREKALSGRLGFLVIAFGAGALRRDYIASTGQLVYSRSGR